MSFRSLLSNINIFQKSDYQLASAELGNYRKQARLQAMRDETQFLKSQLELPPELEAQEGLNQESWQFRQVVDKRNTMPGSGFGYVHEPYATQIQLIWGIERPPDFEKYMQMYVWVPIIKRATDEQVNLSLGKPYTFEYSEQVIKKLDKLAGGNKKLSEDLRDAMLEKVNELNDRIELDKWKIVIGFDMLQMGNAYIENCFEDLDFEETFAQYSAPPDVDKTIDWYKSEENEKCTRWSCGFGMKLYWNPKRQRKN